MWEFSGYEPYYLVYDHFIGDPNCLHVVVFNLEDTQDQQLQHVLFWLNFIQARIAPMEPIGTVHTCHLCSWVLPPSSLLDVGEVRFSVVVPLIQFLALCLHLPTSSDTPNDLYPFSQSSPQLRSFLCPLCPANKSQDTVRIAMIRSTFPSLVYCSLCSV